jgi:fibronectin-binding autotransporter adhesin
MDMKTKNRMACVAALLTLSQPWTAGAASLTWDANNTGAGQTNGAGAWLGANQWWDGVGNVTWTDGDDATFGGPATAGGAVTLGSPAVVNTLTFNPSFTGTYTLGSSGQAMTINSGITKNAGSAAVTLASPITLGGAQTWLNNSTTTLLVNTPGVTNAGFDLTIDGTGPTTFGVINNAAVTLAGSGGLTKNGTGRLVWGGVNAGYSGTTTLNGGVTLVNSIGTIGSGNLTMNGGVYEEYWTNTFTRTLGAGAGQVQIIGGTSGFSESGATGMTVRLNNSAAFEVVWGSALFNPSTLVLQAASAQNGSSLTFDNKIDLNGADRTIANQATGTASATIAQAIRTSSGTAGLVKTGPGQIILSNAANTYNGATTVNQGILTATVTGALPGFATPGNVVVAANATIGVRTGAWTAANIDSLRTAATWSASTSRLGIDTTAGNFSYSSNIIEALTVNKLGSNTLTLSGNNSYTGGTILSGGTLAVGSATALPATGTISFNGGGIQSSDATARTLSNPISFGGDATIGGTGNMTFTDTGVVGLGATRTITVTNSGVNATFAQSFSGAGFGITKAGVGTLTLTGNNTFTGATAINAGTIILNNDGDVTGSAVTFGGNNTGLTITGGSGVTSTWNAGGGTFGTGANLYNNIQVLIDGAGTAGSAVVTNVGTLVWGRTATNSTLLLTNGGQMNVNGEIRIGNPYYSEAGGANLTIQGGAATSTLTGAGTNDFYIGYGERTGSKNNVVTVSSGGVLTGIRDMVVGHVFDAQNNANPSTNNQLLVTGTGTASMRGISLGYANATSSRTATANIVSVTGGGTLSSTGTIYIGRANLAGSQSNGNTMTISGPGSSWSAGGQTVYVGHTNNASAQSNNNILTVDNGGVLSNINNLHVGFGTGTETGNQVVLNGGSITANNITLYAGNSLLIGTAGGALGGDITNNGTFTINSAVPVTLAGNISGAGGLTHAGSGATTLSGGNSYAGDTTVSGGTLLVEGYTEATGLVNVSSGATLGGSGQAGIVTVTDGFFSPGGVADNTMDLNSLTLDPAATLVIGLDDPMLPAWNDLVQISTSLTLAGQINVMAQPGAPGYDFLSATAGTQWLVMTYAPGNLTNAGPVTIGSAPALASGLAWSVDTTTTDGSVFLTVVVPEPASSALLAAGLLVLFLRRQRIS